MFRRTKDKQEEDGSETVEEAEATAPDLDDEAAAPTPNGAAAPEAPNAPDGSAPSGAPDDSLQRDLKELAARMAMLSNNVEGATAAREGLESKLVAMEERMLRLGALAEAVSSKYNPFMDHNAPTDPSWEPDPGAAEVGHAPAPSSPPASPGDVGVSMEPPVEAVVPEVPEPPAEAPAPPEPEPEAPAPAPPEPEPEPPRVLSMDLTQEREPEPREMPRFETDMLMLEWVGMMLRRAGRSGLLDLLEYYEALGWLGRDVKDRALRLAVGVEVNEPAHRGHWRGDLDLHARSLVALERLRGRDVSPTRLETLRMDLERLFGG